MIDHEIESSKLPIHKTSLDNDVSRRPAAICAYRFPFSMLLMLSNGMAVADTTMHRWRQSAFPQDHWALTHDAMRSIPKSVVCFVLGNDILFHFSLVHTALEVTC